MSVTFSSNAVLPSNDTKSVEDESCLCAQLAPSWTYFSKGIEAELAASANPSCPFCKGLGHAAPYESGLHQGPNFSNGNARLVLAALGMDDLDLCGWWPVAEFVALRPPRVYAMGLSEDDVRERLERLMAFAHEAQRLGATTISWG